MTLTLADLKAWTGYDRQADVIRWLDKHGIPWWAGKGGAVCTTIEAINSRLVGGQQREGVRFGQAQA